jgi:hypothetical protein
MGEMLNTHTILLRKPEEKDHLEDLYVDGRATLKGILRN